MKPFATVFVLIGILALCGGIFNWDWYMNHRKARFMVNLFTRNGARFFYALVGTALIVYGVLLLMGFFEN